MGQHDSREVCVAGHRMVQGGLSRPVLVIGTCASVKQQRSELLVTRDNGPIQDGTTVVTPWNIGIGAR